MPALTSSRPTDARYCNSALHRPHDFCTLMHGEVFTNGTFMLMTTATEHPKAKPSSDYLRSEIVLGINYMVPMVRRERT